MKLSDINRILLNESINLDESTENPMDYSALNYFSKAIYQYLATLSDAAEDSEGKAARIFQQGSKDLWFVKNSISIISKFSQELQNKLDDLEHRIKILEEENY